MIRLRFLSFALISVLILIDAARCQSQEVYISTFDRMNGQIEELLASGYLHDLSPSEKPWKLSHVISAIRSDEQRFDNQSRLIADAILTALKPPQRRPGESAGFEGGIDIRGLSSERREGYFIRRGRYLERGFKNELGSTYRAGWWYSRDDSWGIDTRLLFDSDGTDYPWYYGRPRNARIIVQFDHAYAAFKIKAFDLVLGRQRMIWGPSLRGSLLLDDGSPPLDVIRVSAIVSPFRLSWFGARLDDRFNPDIAAYERRFLSGHRLSLNTGRGWELGISETVLYGGQDRLPEIYYSIPVVLYYWEAHNHSIDDNIFWAIDFSWTIDGSGRFYTHFVADDFQYKNNGPQKFAIQLGAMLVPRGHNDWSALIEFNLVDTYVYGQRQRRNVYRYWDDDMARLGSDQFEVFAGLYRKLVEEMKAGIEYTRRAKGEYYSDIPQLNLPVKEPPFPSGIAETADDIRLRISYSPTRYAAFDFAVGYQTIANYRNIEGSDFDEFQATFDISFNFGTGLPFWTGYR